MLNEYYVNTHTSAGAKQYALFLKHLEIIVDGNFTYNKSSAQNMGRDMPHMLKFFYDLRPADNRIDHIKCLNYI